MKQEKSSVINSPSNLSFLVNSSHFEACYLSKQDFFRGTASVSSSKYDAVDRQHVMSSSFLQGSEEITSRKVILVGKQLFKVNNNETKFTVAFLVTLLLILNCHFPARFFQKQKPVVSEASLGFFRKRAILKTLDSFQKTKCWKL